MEVYQFQGDAMAVTRLSSGFILLLCLALAACDDNAGITSNADGATIDSSADGATVDSTPDTAPPVDTAADASSEDLTPSTCEPGEGCFEESCDSADDCLSGICTLSLIHI